MSGVREAYERVFGSQGASFFALVTLCHLKSHSVQVPLPPLVKNKVDSFFSFDLLYSLRL